MDPKRSTPRHIIIETTRLKDNERILKAAKEKQEVTCKGARSKLSSDFPTETYQARREWCEIFKVIKNKDLKPRLLFLTRLLIKMEGEIKSFKDKKELKEFVNTNQY